ncbi:MAG TPA: MarR family transcriptional regulator [Bacillota bacterium]|nr:MarR family transcriptional regulator [Bacillota bacterium]
METDQKVNKALEAWQTFFTINKHTTKLSQQNAESLGISLQQLSILHILHASPGATLKEVTEILVSAKSTVSMSVEGLVNAGLVTRTASEEDRREINLKLTSEGEVLAIKSKRNAYSYRGIALALEKMDEKDVETLIHLNKELLSHLQEIQF